MREGTFESALRQCRHALQTPSRTARHPSRTFTSTSYRQKGGRLPTFHPTSSPELDALLSNVRSRIIMPAHLNTLQRKLIFQTRHHALLRNDPVTISFGDESFTLEPLNPHRDIPASWGSVTRAMTLMGNDAGAWANMPALLAGLRDAGRKLKLRQFGRVVRLAGERGVVAQVVLEGVRRAERTGLKLAEIELVREVMWACRVTAMSQGWSKDATAKGLKYAEEMAGWLEHEDMASKGKEGTADPRCEPDVIAVLLELAAVRAKWHLDGVDQEGKVLKYFERLIPNLEGRSIELPGEDEKLRGANADYELMRWVPIMNGLRLAKDVLGQESEVDAISKKMNEARSLILAVNPDAVDHRRGIAWLKDVEDNL